MTTPLFENRKKLVCKQRTNALIVLLFLTMRKKLINNKQEKHCDVNITMK